MSFNVKVTYKNVPNFTLEEFKKVILEECEKWAWSVVNRIKLDLTGKKLNVKSGRLRNSIMQTVRQSAKHTIINIGSWNVVYAKIHDDKTFTIIRPKQKQWLTIPVSDAIKGRARQYSNAFFIRSRQGNILLARERKRSFDPLFVLKKEVKIKGTGYITDNVSNMKPMLELALFLETERDIKAKLK